MKAAEWMAKASEEGAFCGREEEKPQTSEPKRTVDGFCVCGHSKYAHSATYCKFCDSNCVFRQRESLEPQSFVEGRMAIGQPIDSFVGGKWVTIWSDTGLPYNPKVQGGR